MANASINDLYLYTLRGELFGQRIISTYHYRIDAITGTPDAQVAALELLQKLNDAGGIRATYLACVNNDYLMLEEWCQRIAPQRLAAVRNTVNLNGLYAAGVSRTANTAASITRRGVLATRSSISSLHVPIGQSIDEMADGFLTQDLKDVLTTHAAQIPLQVTTATGAITWTPVIPFVANPVASHDIEIAFVQDTTRTMRRRTVRLGE